MGIERDPPRRAPRYAGIAVSVILGAVLLSGWMLVNPPSRREPPPAFLANAAYVGEGTWHQVDDRMYDLYSLPVDEREQQRLHMANPDRVAVSFVYHKKNGTAPAFEEGFGLKHKQQFLGTAIFAVRRPPNFYDQARAYIKALRR